MATISAKQLKQRTGEIIRRVRAGESMTLTYRGRPVATIAPASGPVAAGGSRPRDPAEVWRELEAALAEAQPQFPSWQEATAWARGRS